MHHRGARAFFASHGVYRYCPNVNDDPAVVVERDLPLELLSSLLPDVEPVETVVVVERRAALCASVLNSQSFVLPPGRANASNPPAATVRGGLESTDRLRLSFDETAEVTTATVCLAVPNTGRADVTTVFAALDFDLLLGTGSTLSGRFEAFFLWVDDTGEEEHGTLL